MLDFNETREYFNSLPKEKLLEYYDDYMNLNSETSELLKEVVLKCFGQIDILHLQLNKLHWHFISALVEKLKSTL